MHFITQASWENKDPVYKLLDGLKEPRSRWRAIEFSLAYICYHVRILVGDDDGSAWVHLLVGDFENAYHLLNEEERSMLDIQVPSWCNEGSLGIHSVSKLYKTEGSNIPIAECTNGKMYILSIGNRAEEIDPHTVDKRIIWTRTVEETAYRKPNLKLVKSGQYK